MRGVFSMCQSSKIHVGRGHDPADHLAIVKAVNICQTLSTRHPERAQRVEGSTHHRYHLSVNRCVDPSTPFHSARDDKTFSWCHLHNLVNPVGASAGSCPRPTMAYVTMGQHLVNQPHKNPALHLEFVKNSFKKLLQKPGGGAILASYDRRL